MQRETIKEWEGSKIILLELLFHLLFYSPNFVSTFGGRCLRPQLVYSLKFYLFKLSLVKRMILISILKKKKKKQEATGHWIRRKCYVIQVYSHDLLIL